MTRWRQWLDHPERSTLRNAIFQLHLWVGAIASLYFLLMSISGSIVVFRNFAPASPWMARTVELHTKLLSGSSGEIVNGVGGIMVTLLCLTGAVIWWPGIAHWRRSLTVNWKAHYARVFWDLHSAVGFWCFPLLLIWGVSAIYFAFPQTANVFLALDPADRFTDNALFWLSQLHFGRFALMSEIAWSAAGLAPAVLGFTGIFICCRRIMFKKTSHPDRHS